MPDAPTFKIPLVTPEIVRFVVEAVVAVIIVVDAYGIVSAELFGALKVTLPFRYASAPENVVVAVQVGTPFNSASTWPGRPAVVVAAAPVPLP